MATHRSLGSWLGSAVQHRPYNSTVHGTGLEAPHAQGPRGPQLASREGPVAPAQQLPRTSRCALPSGCSSAFARTGTPRGEGHSLSRSLRPFRSGCDIPEWAVCLPQGQERRPFPTRPQPSSASQLLPQGLKAAAAPPVTAGRPAGPTALCTWTRQTPHSRTLQQFEIQSQTLNNVSINQHHFALRLCFCKGTVTSSRHFTALGRPTRLGPSR